VAKGEVSLLNVSLLAFIFFIAVGTLWITNATFGQYLAPEHWLIILGIMGILAILTYRKHRE
jgi:hypothetical protein